MKKKIIVKMDEPHTEMLEALTPFFGKNINEVLENITIRWLEEHIGTEAIKTLEEIGVIKGYRQHDKILRPRKQSSSVL